MHNGNGNGNDVTDGVDLDRLVPLLLVAGGPSHLRLADSGALHRAVVAAHQEGQLAGVVSRLGHRPDPMMGRRVTGLDGALRRLVDDGGLVETSAGRWRISARAASSARHRLAALPLEHRRAIGELAAAWRHLAQHDAKRRRLALAQASSV